MLRQYILAYNPRRFVFSFYWVSRKANDMSSEMSREKSTDENAGGGQSDRRARSNAEAPAAVKVLGGTRANEKRFNISALIMWLAAIALVVLAIPVYKGLWYKSGNGWDHFSYWIGIIGSVMMLLMLLYPIRKHAKFAQNWGALRYWFMLHMMFGIGGPILVLFHTTFHFKSLNATISLGSMLLVALSGIVGRFIYRHIHRGLYGRQSDLKELQKSVNASQEKIDSLLMDAPAISDKLKKFSTLALSHEGAFSTRVWRFATLSWYRRKLSNECSEDLRKAVVLLAKSQHWNAQQQEMKWHEAVQKVKDYLAAVQDAAQFSTYEWLFRLWHIAHSPFVWLLGFSAIVHVIAVNMY